MLLRFGVKNYRSLKSYEELSLVASSLDDNPDGLIADDSTLGEKILPKVVIYGANASGKSNLLRAISFMKDAVLLSHSQNTPSGNIPHDPFALDPAYLNEPSCFDIDFIQDGVRYHYGFHQTDSVFTREWLYAFPNGKRRMLFDREENKFTFGRNLKGQNDTIRQLTRPNSLFISAAAQNNHVLLSSVSQFFLSIRAQVPLSVQPFAVAVRGSTERSMKRVIELLGEMGTGAVAYRRRKIDPSPKQKAIWTDLEAVFKKHWKNYPEDNNFDYPGHFELAHRGRDGTEVYLNLANESEGTRRLIILLDEVFLALEAGELLIIDELNASLHTQACEKIISLFSMATINRKGAQLIATTHDTNLLTSPSVRRDEVWFTEQQPDGSTALFPLTDIRTRKGDNIERGYLQGRFGAVPFQRGRGALIEGQ